MLFAYSTILNLVLKSDLVLIITRLRLFKLYYCKSPFWNTKCTVYSSIHWSHLRPHLPCIYPSYFPLPIFHLSPHLPSPSPSSIFIPIFHLSTHFPIFHISPHLPFLSPSSFSLPIFHLPPHLPSLSPSSISLPIFHLFPFHLHLF